MKKNVNYGWIIFCVIIIILFIPIISDYVKKQNIEVISVETLNNKIKSKESFVVYSGEIDKNVKLELRSMREKTRNDYSYDYGVYNLKDSKQMSEIFEKDTKVALVIEGDVQKLYSKYDKASIEKDVDVFLINNITDKNKSYKVFDDFKAYKNAVKSKDTTMIVFGYDGCSFCNKFQPVYNAIANKYDLDIYYFNSNTYDKNEYTKVINYDLTVPGKCSNEGKDFKLSDGFGTPLTIFTKKGKIVDCIAGAVSRSELVTKLKSVKMISE